jgi:microsomal epoxide hydrolase
MSGTVPVEPFEIAVPEATLDDLRARLQRTRWPNEPAGADWEFGANLAYMKELIEYWRNGYDWRARERKLNRFPQFRARLGEHSIHFVHEKGSGEEALPLILTHGWPGSFVEYLDLVEPLAHPERCGGEMRDSFDVVVPSLPGYGFSSKPAQPLGPKAIAALWNRLMTEALGYPRYGAQGGDWGATVSSWLGRLHPESMAGLHLHLMAVRPTLDANSPPLRAEETAWIAAARAMLRPEQAYQAIQATKPQTLAFGLNDSPAGLLAWQVEKFERWGDTKGDIESRFSKDLLLTNATIYWASETINTANWIYRAARQDGSLHMAPGERIEVPTGFAIPPIDLTPPPPRSWAERVYNVQRWSELSMGGHFLALEEGGRLVEEIRRFFRPLRG